MNAITHYRGSRGTVEIATMPLPYAANALAKLQRECVDGSREAEISAIAAHVAKLQEDHVEAGSVDPAPTLAEDVNPRIHLGANHPPEETAAEPAPFLAIRAHVDDLLVEARNWADGATVESQAQADEIARLIEQFRQAERTADDARKDEVKPLDDQRDAIQARWNIYIAPLKNKKPGKIPLAVEALKSALAPWLRKLDDEKRAREDAARKAAEEAAAKAAEAMRAAEPTNLEAREAAEDLVQAAADLAADANRAAKDKAHAKGDGKAIGLRTVYRPVLVNPSEALKHYATMRPADLKEILIGWAEEDVRRSIRTIPGFEVREEKVL